MSGLNISMKRLAAICVVATGTYYQVKLKWGFRTCGSLAQSYKIEWAKSTSRMYYFVDEGKVYCGTVGMCNYCIEVKHILDCPKAGYDISSKVYNFTLPTDLELQTAELYTKYLVAHLEKSIKFLDRVIEPDDLYKRNWKSN